VLAAAAFHSNGHQGVGEIQEAFHLLDGVLGVTFASTLFALALLASGQNSTLTGTMAGQVVMEGFIHLRIAPWLRRLVTRLLAVIPAIIVIAVAGDGATTRLLLLSQVILSMQLSFAVIPLVQFTGSKRIMGEFVNAAWVRVAGWSAALLIAGLNIWLLLLQFHNGSLP
jgi:manganese transport protein